MDKYFLEKVFNEAFEDNPIEIPLNLYLSDGFSSVTLTHIVLLTEDYENVFIECEIDLEISNWKYPWSVLEHLRTFLALFNVESIKLGEESKIAIHTFSEGHIEFADYLARLNGQEGGELLKSDNGKIDIWYSLKLPDLDCDWDELTGEKIGQLSKQHMFEALMASVSSLKSAHDLCLQEFHQQFYSKIIPADRFLAVHEKLDEFCKFISKKRRETAITKFLEDNPEILQLGLCATDLNPQVLLEWQFPTEEDNLKPDFMPVCHDGFADIVDFKLPSLNSKPIVGKSNRQQPSFEIDTALSQISKYKKWCSQIPNQNWLWETKKIRVKNPRIFLVIGYSDDFSPEERQELRDIRDGIIWTYDEIINMVKNLMAIFN
jgi:hypothetical protein